MKDTRTPEDVYNGVPAPEIEIMPRSLRIGLVLSGLLAAFGLSMFTYQTISTLEEPKIESVMIHPINDPKTYQKQAENIFKGLIPKRERTIATMGLEGPERTPEEIQRQRKLWLDRFQAHERARQMENEDYFHYGPP